MPLAIVSGTLIIDRGLNEDGDPDWIWEVEGMDDETAIGLLTLVQDQIRRTGIVVFDDEDEEGEDGE